MQTLIVFTFGIHFSIILALIIFVLKTAYGWFDYTFTVGRFL